MKRWMMGILALTLVGCGQATEEPLDSGSLPLEGAAMTAAEAVPSFTEAVFSVDGVEQAVYGTFLLQVTDGGPARYVFSAASRDNRLSLSGGFDLSGELAPRPAADKSLTSRYEGKGDRGFAWIFDNRGTFRVTEGNGDKRAAREYMIRSLTVQVDGNGALSAELRGVESKRLDAKARRILPGEDRVITVRGRLVGACQTRLRPQDPMSPVVADPRNSSPECQALLSQL
ncbi:uncharacterized protein SOCE26_048030 [Sorangium cellulosum]|uniref:Lipoprotein n=1 Tax=Sorangium cellulosum TaxID=56 RepID=A0A2L0EVR0_SORCE|nr:hypothetical protein [Sorangium cellulosum]AUX43355.1 uncharacterized protein SOCE26_048030 [Sorangium cellulosum]